jgi:hypothetical protein
MKLPPAARYELAYHTAGHWRIVDHVHRAYAGLPYPDGVHRPLMFTVHWDAQAWLSQCRADGLDMNMPDGMRPMYGVEYEQWRAVVG